MRIIPQYEPLIGKEEKFAVIDYLDSGGWLTEFTKTLEFADEIGKFTNSKFSFILSNGTLTLSAALLAYDIGPGDEVIVPNFTMVASATSAIILGCNVVFVDIERDTFCLDFDDFKSKVSKNTRALILVSINGRYPSRLDDILIYCRENNIKVIEDAAQSLGSYYNGKHIGKFGDIASFSFSMPKIITTGQGGALITDDEFIANKIKKIRDFGREKPGADHYLTLGWNFKFTDLQAVIGLAQFKQIDSRIEKKRSIFLKYQVELTDVKEVKFIRTDLNDTTPWFVDVLVENREEFVNYLRSFGIMTRNFYPSLHSEPAFKGYKGVFPNTDYVTSRGVWLPSSLTLIDDDIKYICNLIKSYYGYSK